MTSRRAANEARGLLRDVTVDVEQRETRTVHAPLESLERAFIDEFVRAHGHDPRRLSELRSYEREMLLSAAGLYASAKMAEIEARSHFVGDMRVQSRQK